ncbi:Conserved_hypothetical protein [Hexamita inflata]|uniref:Uncharacterized protein n=1 Tax=Hexamita inflata TaxID=28002 RepID=A0ABP1KAZ0_9EUKA
MTSEFYFMIFLTLIGQLHLANGLKSNLQDYSDILQSDIPDLSTQHIIIRQLFMYSLQRQLSNVKMQFPLPNKWDLQCVQRLILILNLMEFMKENLKTKKDRVKVDQSAKMVTYMKVILQMMYLMDWVDQNFQMEVFMKDLLLTVKWMVMENSPPPENSPHAEGDEYQGSFVNGLKSGQGQYVWTNGDKYEGAFENDLKSGYTEWLD